MTRKNKYNVVQISPEFKRKVAVFKRYLYRVKDQCDQLETQIRNHHERPSVMEKQIKAKIHEFYPSYSFHMDKHFGVMWRILEQQLLFDEISNAKNESYRIHQQYYIRELKEFFSGTEFTKQVYYKPLGYAGDFHVMRYLYRKKSAYNSLYFNLVDKYTMDLPISKSVRNRIIFIRPKIEELIEKSESRKDIVSIASGSAPEVIRILNKRNNQKLDFHITLFDAENSALDYCRKKIDKIIGSSRHISYVNGSILNVDDAICEKADLIYSLGLFDYLKDGLFVKTARKLYALLKQGGMLIVGNVSPLNTSRAYMALVGEWYIIHRTRDDLKNLAQRCGFSNYEITQDTTGVQLYIVARK